MSKVEGLDSERQQKLEKLLKRAEVPTLPIVAQKLVTICNDEHADFGDFAEVIQADPGLASRILRMANSAFYGLRHKATTLERAIGTLGLKNVKTISLGFHLASTLSKLSSEDGFDMQVFWQQNVLRGALAKELANNYCPARREEAFLVGLLQDCGVPFLVQAWGKTYAEFWGKGENSPSSLYQLEQELFGFDHVKAAETITAKWDLPDMLAAPIRAHHQRGPIQPNVEEQDKLAQIAYFVATLSLHNPDSLGEEDLQLTEYARQVFGLDNDDLRKLLLNSQEEFRKVAYLFTDILGENVDISELLTEARDLLVDIESDETRKRFDLEAELDRLKVNYDNLAKSVEESVLAAGKDDLTGLARRTELENYLNISCNRTQNDQSTLFVLFFDIDNFKHFNDQYGHGIGDRTIKSLADLLHRVFPQKACLARYGGDEFVVALAGLQFDQALTLSKLLLQRIREVVIPLRATDEQKELRVACSVGMVFCESGSQPGNAARLLELVDHQMYEAKRAGKNQLRYCILEAQG